MMKNKTEEQYYTHSSFCYKCGKHLMGVFYIVDGLRLCGECYSRDVSPSAPYGWICPRCGRANSPYTAQCLCNVDGRIKITYR